MKVIAESLLELKIAMNTAETISFEKIIRFFLERGDRQICSLGPIHEEDFEFANNVLEKIDMGTVA